MSENEDFESLKVTELQNELKKRGLDTKGRKADLIARLREAINNGTEVANAEHSDEEPTAAVIEDETASPSSPIEDDAQEQPQPVEEPLPAVVPPEQPDLTLSNKRPLEEEEHVPNLPEDNDHDDLEKLSRKKKSRWGSEEESEEKQSVTKLVPAEEDRSSTNRRSERSPEKETLLPEEETVQCNSDDVVLDFYTSDLNLTIHSDCLSATTKSKDALCFLWAGTRATYGFKQGRICYEIRITEILDCPDLPESEKEKSGVRIGWSNLSSGLHALQLGEINDSFAYASNGRKLSRLNGQSSEDAYGEPLNPLDVIGCYLDSDEQFLRISFTKNGSDYGQAFEIEKTNWTNADQTIFYPHILVKNVKFECNFGQLETPWSEIKSDYLFPQAVPPTERIRSAEPLVDRSDCQVLFLSGLTCSGKTTWAKKYLQENPSKNFHLLNIESVLQQMTVRQAERNDGTMLRVNVCLQKLIEIAAQRRRNFIVDHVNTTRETQGKRQRLFTGYHRIGVVIAPEEEELRRRVEKVERAENLSIPSQWLRDAKSKFHFMQKSSSLEAVIYPELSYEEARSSYERARRDSDAYHSSRYDRHDDYRSSRYERNRYEDRERYDRRERSRSRSRERRSRESDRERDRRTFRDDSRYSHRNEQYRGGGGYSDYRQDSRNYQRGGDFHGRGGNNTQQWNDNARGGYQQQQQQRNDYGGRGRGGNQYNNRGSYYENQRGGYRPDFNHQQRNRQFNDYENNSQQQRNNSGFMPNNHFNQQNDRQGFGSRVPPSMPPQQQQLPRSQPLLQTPSSTQPQFPLQQLPSANPTLSLQTSTPTVAAQANSLDSWLALCAAALKPQVTQPQPDVNALGQQWSQWLKTAQMSQAAQPVQVQPQLNIQPTESQPSAVSDAAALYYQAYYAQLAAAAAGAVAPPATNEK